MTCKDNCLYYEVCADFRRNICEADRKRFEEYRMTSDGLCASFKNKADFVEVPCRCEKCKFKDVDVFNQTVCRRQFNVVKTEDDNYCKYGERRTG